jgi:hypothetical protein
MAIKRDIDCIQEYITYTSEAIAYSTAGSISQAGPYLKQITAHLDAVGSAGDMTVTINSANGSAYDTVLDTQDMSTETDYVFTPGEDGWIKLFPGDKIGIAWANSSNTIAGVTVTYKVK